MGRPQLSIVPSDFHMQVLRIIAKHADRPVDELEDATNLDALGMDSISYVEMTITLEDRFKIVLGDSWANWVTVRDIVETVRVMMP